MDEKIISIEKAIAVLTGYSKLVADVNLDSKLAFKVAIEALEKQIPKKPIDKFSTHAIYDNDGNYLEQLDITTFKCPVCNHILASGEISITDCDEIHCCDNCGQAIDWGDTE